MDWKSRNSSVNWQFPHRLRYQIPDIPNKFRQTSLTNTSPTPSTVSRFQRGDNEIYVTQFSLLHPPQCSTVFLLHQPFHFNQSFTNVPHLFFRTVSIHLKKKKKRVSYNVSKQLRWHSAKHPLSIERNPRNKAAERWGEIRVERERERER